MQVQNKTETILLDFIIRIKYITGENGINCGNVENAHRKNDESCVYEVKSSFLG